MTCTVSPEVEAVGAAEARGLCERLGRVGVEARSMAKEVSGALLLLVISTSLSLSDANMPSPPSCTNHHSCTSASCSHTLSCNHTLKTRSTGVSLLLKNTTVTSLRLQCVQHKSTDVFAANTHHACGISLCTDLCCQQTFVLAAAVRVHIQELACKWYCCVAGNPAPRDSSTYYGSSMHSVVKLRRLLPQIRTMVRMQQQRAVVGGRMAAWPSTALVKRWAGGGAR